MSKYNGWTNYDTWNMNLTFFDGMSKHEFLADNVEELADELCEMIEAYMDAHTTSTIAYCFACDALNVVNWNEIAEAILND